MQRFPKATEGELGPRHATLVRREALAEVASEIDLGAYLVLAPADAAAKPRGVEERGARAGRTDVDAEVEVVASHRAGA